MQRIALILLLYILLGSAPHTGLEPPLPHAAIAVRAVPLAVDPGQARRDYGPLRLLGLWALKSDHRSFGGMSGLLAEPHGSFIGLSDSGEAMRFGLDGRPAQIGALPRLPEQRLEFRWQQDSESLTRDPVSGRIWVGFERVQRICRYAPGFTAIEGCASPPALRRWPEEGGMESLTRLADGRFLAIGERANGASGGYDVLLWPSDPVAQPAPPPVHLIYRGPTGYRPTDMVWLGGDRLLVLNRRLTIAAGFTARLALVRLPALRDGAVLIGEPIADFHWPGPADNMEALALGREESGPIIWVGSDDNRFFLQRSLLFKFALPPGWLSDSPAP